MSPKVAIVADGDGTRGHTTAAVLAAGGRTVVAATSGWLKDSAARRFRESPESGDGLLPIRR
jgi:hypothetical protein